jgi:hypothetical protein
MKRQLSGGVFVSHYQIQWSVSEWFCFYSEISRMGLYLEKIRSDFESTSMCLTAHAGQPYWGWLSKYLSVRRHCIQTIISQTRSVSQKLPVSKKKCFIRNCRDSIWSINDTEMFTLAVFNNSIEFEPDTAGKKSALYCPTKIILCNVFWLVFFDCNCSCIVGKIEHKSSS